MIEIQVRKELIRTHPLFQALSEPAVRELAAMAFEKHCARDDIVLRQGDLVDAVYLVASGEIEVRVSGVPRTILRKSDAIGLSESGFYSETGLRTATLIAIKDTSLIGWSLEALQGFVSKHSEFQDSLKTAAEFLRRASFIKQALPFTKLPSEVIAELARNIVEINLLSGTELFHQGDFADHCYLVCSGLVEILIDNSDGTSRSVGKLGAGCLFGEGALLAKPERNATVRVSQDARLLVLKAEQLLGLLRHRRTHESISQQIIKNCRPKQVGEIEYFDRVSDDEQHIWVLKGKESDRYYQLGEEGWVIWQQLDGHKSFEEIGVNLFKSHQSISFDLIAGTVFGLADAGFVLLPELGATHPMTKEQFGRQRSN
jgi:CRP-like cAMP-binding protein